MRFRFILLMLLFSALNALGEAPEQIYPKTKIIKPVDWYLRQSALWEKELIDNYKNENAWLNFYTSSRYAMKDQNVLKSIVAAMNLQIPLTFTYYLVNGWNEGYTQEGYDFIQQAFLKEPSNENVFASQILMNELAGNSDLRKEFGEKYYNTHTISFGLLNYSYNVLMSLEPNAILIIESDNTSIPVFILQDIMQVRTDVRILCLDLLINEKYRQTKFNELGIKPGALSHPVSKKDICKSLPVANEQLKFYYALTLSKENIADIKDQLYVVGLASQASPRRIDNISRIKDNLENNFLLDYLTVDFNGESGETAGKVLSANYLVSMLMLADHYKSQGEIAKVKELEKLINTIADQTSKQDLVNQYLHKDSKRLPFVPAKLDFKMVEGIFKPVKDNIYAQEYEVTNNQYNQFLLYLQENNPALFEKCKIQLDQYEEPALSLMMSYHSMKAPVKKEKGFSNYPVMNISYDAAKEYCSWLTEQYNGIGERKYKKVIFRLPTIQEWQLAAAGIKSPQSWELSGNKVVVKIYENGKEHSKNHTTKTVSLDDPEILYPWFENYNFRNTALNSKGCPLGNFKFPESQKPCLERLQTADGFWMTAFVQAYFPNGIGLYDVVGNVSEMTSEKGKACGGSWNHTPVESTIKSINTYDGPSSDIGFRVFMEVKEQ